MAQILTLTLGNDEDAECPIGRSGDPKEKIITWEDNRDKIDEYFDWTKDGYVPKIGLRRQLATGTAFLLSLYEHSLRKWSIAGTGPQCRWDTTQNAGIYWLPSDVPKDQRETYAEAALEEYTDWCNGACYYYRIEDQDENEIDACGGYYGDEYMMSEINDELTSYMQKHEVEEIVLAGNAAWLADYADLPKGTGQ